MPNKPMAATPALSSMVFTNISIGKPPFGNPSPRRGDDANEGFPGSGLWTRPSEGDHALFHKTFEHKPLFPIA